jgi:hypothetical protein
MGNKYSRESFLKREGLVSSGNMMFDKSCYIRLPRLS